MNLITKLLRLWHTVKHLKFIQFYYRIYFNFISTSSVKTSPVKLHNVSSKPIFYKHKRKSLVSKNEFIFFDEKGDIDSTGWNPQNYQKLWIYNLHYFDFLNFQREKDDEDDFIQNNIINRWINENPCFIGIGWDSYPTSLRIVNWVKWIMNGNYCSSKMLESLNLQTEWLYKRIEWHLLGNHIFANAKGLLFSSVLLEGEQSKKWYKKSISIIKRELNEQVLEDGGNFELSTMYHAIFLEDLLDIIQLSMAFPESFKEDDITQWQEIATKMLHWLEVMTHRDGNIALFNDSAFNVSLSTADLVKYAHNLNLSTLSSKNYTNNKIRFEHLKESGYAKISNSNIDLFIDIANVGPSYLPAHAHADTLSFELTYKNQRVFVNGGTSTYEISDKRLRERSTSNHNTVVLNDYNSSDVWGSFRTGRRAKPINLNVKHFKDSITISCAHDGYTFLPGRPIHYREWYINKNKLCVTDKISGKYNSAIAHYIIHPDVKIVENFKGNLTLKLIDGSEVNMITNGVEYDIDDFMYAPNFGNGILTKVIKLHGNNQHIKCSLDFN